ncbi:Xaa-Pro dipeptidase [Franzmannia pantelleriensis]|uniref:Xaa-Pro dipeptidase n=1 Tax=Franzmannia pantelleriensis TaxID=48727 RepID=A0A1G9N2A8_9GAMM|nr:Xaa-Pro peptidase family protein [Halomonas pantelleriensis]SDL80391.1 Xaa-Pro dipeptidase [Halomonas pantelleriensis]
MNDVTSPISLPFTKQEHATRLDAIKKEMHSVGIEVLLDSDPANIFYTTGYDAVSYYTPQTMIISIYRAEPILVIRSQDLLAAKVRTHLSEKSIIGWQDYMVDNEHSHPFELVMNILNEHNLSRLKVGIDVDAGMTTHFDTSFLIKRLKKPIAEVRRLINFVRIVKTDREIDYMKQAARITESAMRAGLDAMTAGVRESDVIANVYHAQIKGTSEYGGDYPANPPVMPTGRRSATPHLTWSDDPLMPNQNLTLELSGARYRYHSPLARTVYIGRTPPEDLADATKHASEGVQATLRSISPGMTLSEVHAVWEKVNIKHNLGKTSRLGYSVGCAFPPSWLERTASIRPEDTTPLVPNMTFHLIAGIWKNHWGAEVSETFRVTDRGAETLCDMSQELYIR